MTLYKFMFKKFFLKISEREVRDYTENISLLTSEERGIHLAYSCLTFIHLVGESDVDVEKIINTKEDIYGGELTDLVLQTNSLLKDYIRAGEMQGAAGTKVWNETFRCLVHPEFTQYGKRIWGNLSAARQEAVEHLSELQEIFKGKGRNDMVLRIEKAKQYVDLIPSRFL